MSESSKPLTIIRTVEAGSFRSQRPLDGGARQLSRSVRELRNAWGDDIRRVFLMRSDHGRRRLMILSASEQWRVHYLIGVAS